MKLRYLRPSSYFFLPMRPLPFSNRVSFGVERSSCVSLSGFFGALEDDEDVLDEAQLVTARPRASATIAHPGRETAFKLALLREPPPEARRSLQRGRSG